MDPQAQPDTVPTAISIIADLQSRLAALSDEALLTPPDDAFKPEDSYTVYGPTTDSMRRLLTLSSVVADEHNLLVKEFAKFEEGLGLPSGLSAHMPELVEELFVSDFSPRERVRYESLKREIRMKYELFTIVRNLFWYEVRVAFPNSSSEIVVLTDWSIASRSERKRRRGSESGFDFLDELLHGLFGRRTRR